MRRRLYQALPENSEMIDDVLSAVEEKTKKRLYAESVVRENGVSASVGTTCIKLSLFFEINSHWQCILTGTSPH